MNNEVDPIIQKTDEFVSSLVKTPRERVDLYIAMAIHEVIRLGLSERMAHIVSSSVRTIFAQAVKKVPNPRISQHETSSSRKTQD